MQTRELSHSVCWDHLRIAVLPRSLPRVAASRLLCMSWPLQEMNPHQPEKIVLPLCEHQCLLEPLWISCPLLVALCPYTFPGQKKGPDSLPAMMKAESNCFPPQCPTVFLSQGPTFRPSFRSTYLLHAPNITSDPSQYKIQFRPVPHLVVVKPNLPFAGPTWGRSLISHPGCLTKRQQKSALQGGNSLNNPNRTHVTD